MSVFESPRFASWDPEVNRSASSELRTHWRLAEEAGLDLVEVAPNAKPPVAKLMDYGKYKYEAAQKAAMLAATRRTRS